MIGNEAKKADRKNALMDNPVNSLKQRISTLNEGYRKRDFNVAHGLAVRIVASPSFEELPITCQGRVKRMGAWTDFMTAFEATGFLRSIRLNGALGLAEELTSSKVGFLPADIIAGAMLIPRIRLVSGEKGLAFEYATEAKKNYPESSSLALIYGFVQMQLKDSLFDAYQTMGKVERLARADGILMNVGHSYYNKAVIYQRFDNPELMSESARQAIEAYEKCLTFYPGAAYYIDLAKQKIGQR